MEKLALPHLPGQIKRRLYSHVPNGHIWHLNRRFHHRDKPKPVSYFFGRFAP